MGDVTETVTEMLPSIGKKLIYFTATKTGATDTVTFSDYKTVDYCAGQTGGVDDPVTAISTTQVTFSTGTGTLKGFAIVSGQA